MNEAAYEMLHDCDSCSKTVELEDEIDELRALYDECKKRYWHQKQELSDQRHENERLRHLLETR